MARFGRIITSGRRLIPQIDGLRFLAISAVVLYHVAHTTLDSGNSATAPGRLLALLHATGSFGVPLFFTLSGFLLALPFARAELVHGEPVQLRKYFARRLTRLEAPYVLMLLCVFALDLLRNRARIDLAHLAACLTYQHSTIYRALNAMNGATWSLEVEVQFYCLTPVLALLLRVPTRALRRAVLCGAIVLFALAARSRLSEGPLWYLCVFGHLHEFFAGYLLADIFVADWREDPVPAAGWDVVSLLGWPAIPILLTHRFAVVDVALPFLILALYCAALRGRVSRWLFSRPALVVVGGACYTIYLVHGPVMDLVLSVAEAVVGVASAEAMFLGYAAVMLPAVLAVSAVFYLLVERPCMDPGWPAKLAARARAPRAALGSVEPAP